ncbi:cell division protein FtsQ/DivIB [Corynebacterium camporealensis]
MPGSKKLWISIIGVILGIAVVAVAVVWATPVFKVNQFDVRGNQHLAVEEVEEMTGVELESNLVRVDVHDAATGVAQHPWVASATVSRSLPNTLVVELQEREAVAFRKDRDGDHLIDASGNEFVIDTPPENSVELTGDLESGSEEMADAVEAVAALPPEIRAQVRELEVEGKDALNFHLNDDRTVFWGSSNEDNENKALAFETVLKMEGQHWNISNPDLVTSR